MAMPILIKILAGLFAGVAGITMMQHPEIAKSALPSVGIVLVEQTAGSPTSGTVYVAGDHLLVTASHVVAGGRHILVKFRSTEWIDAQVVESDAINDVAVLSYEGPDVPALPLGDFSAVKAGENAIVIAFPSVEELAKKSPQSDLQAELAKAQTAVEGTIRGIRGSLLVIETPDVPRNGGPVLNVKGQVVGVVRGRLDVDTPGVVAYAAPSTMIESLLTAATRRRASEIAAAAAPPQPQPAAAAASTGAPPAPEPSDQSGASAGSAPSQAPQTPSQPASPAPAAPAAPEPSQPAPPQLAQSASVPPAATGASYLIVPGKSVGAATIGAPIREEIARLGPSKGTLQMDDGTAMYRWFEPPINAGIGVRTAKNGTVSMAWVLNDERYRTKEGLHVGSSEAEVRAALGNPTRVEANAQAKTRTLIYESLGVWFSIQLDQQYSYYNAVHDIGVMPPK